MVDPSAFAPADIVGAYSRGLQVRQQQEQYQNRKRLGDLLPVVLGRGGGVIDESGATQAGRDAAMAEIAHIDPRLFMELDDRQRQQAAAELDDVSAAVRWADTPEKWAQVQQYYGSHGHDVSGYTFDNREAYLLSLGKMGEYLKGAAKPEYRTLEPGGSLIDVSNGQPRVVIVPNDGSHETGAPVQSGDITATGPGGQKIRFNQQSGQWEPIQGGQSASPTGGFPGSGYGGQ